MLGDAVPSMNFVRLLEVVPMRPARLGEPSPRRISLSRFELVVPAFPAIEMRLIYVECALTPNENKMSDGHRERASLEMEGF
jgi:hypothetical protein